MRVIPRLTIIGLLFVAGSVHAQGREAATPMETYRFNVSVPIAECTFYGVTPTGTPAGGVQEYAPAGSRFTYLNDAAQANVARVVFQFLTYKDQDLQLRFNARKTATDSVPRTFCVDKAIFDRTTTRVYDPWSWDLAAGVLLLPIKMRLGGGGRAFDFSKDVTLGTVAGPRWRLDSERELFISALVGAGLTAVTLDSASTGGVIRGSTDRAAVTLTAGTMLEINRFQLGIMVGSDRISNPNQSDWRYHGKPWLAVGLGYTLLSAPPKAADRGQQTRNP
jgi:hypothetical protein